MATRRATGAAPLPTRNVQDAHLAPVCHQVARPAVLPHLVPTLIPLQITADTTAGTDTSMASTTTMAEQDDTSTGPMYHQYLTKVRHAIERGEFVELSKLLTTHLGSGSSSKRSSSTRSITGLESWLEAWSIYAAVLSSHKPHLAPDLFQYQDFITMSSCRFQPYAWLQYDAQFRLKMASNPGTCWSSINPELVATWLSADATKRTSTCFSCGSPNHMSADCPLRVPPKNSASRCPVCNISGHMARDCPQLASNKQSKTSSRAKDDKYCHLYNKRGTCFRGSRCPYNHACSECNGGHPSRAYPQAR